MVTEPKWHPHGMGLRYWLSDACFVAILPDGTKAKRAEILHIFHHETGRDRTGKWCAPYEIEADISDPAQCELVDAHFLHGAMFDEVEELWKGGN